MKIENADNNEHLLTEVRALIVTSRWRTLFPKTPHQTQTNERQRWCRFLNEHPLSFGSPTREI